MQAAEMDEGLVVKLIVEKPLTGRVRAFLQLQTATQAHPHLLYPTVS